MGSVGRELDGHYGVIEHTHGGGRLWSDGAAPGVDDYIKGLDADLLQHGAEQGGLVFTVAVVMSEDIGGRMRLPAAYTQLNRHITDIVLNELGQRLHFLD